MFDFTAQIKLTEKTNLALYKKLRLLIFICFILSWLYFGYNLILPKESYTFSFDNPNSLKNTIINPRQENNQLNFSIASKQGYFNKVYIEFIVKSERQNLLLDNISVKKSYQSFFYPDAKIIGFKNGYQLKNNGNYYIISNDELRKFSSIELAQSMGYNIDNFQEVSEESLKYNFHGKDIDNADDYPDFTTFKIKNNYYQLNKGLLQPFTSEEAFSTYYKKTAAISKDENFLNQFAADAVNPLSFASSSLIAVGIAVYVVDENSIIPVSSPLAFEAAGFNWEDIREADSEEAELFEKSKQTSTILPQPNGTVFKTIENEKYYLIADNHKRLIPTADIANSYLINTPIAVSEKSLNLKSSCQFNISLINTQKYACQMDISEMNNLIGNNFIFSADIKPNTELETLNVYFKKNPNWKNIHYTLSNIKQKLLMQYGKN